MIWNEKYETMPLEERRKLQGERLADCCRRVYEHVPFYRRAFEAKGIRPEDIHTVDDLKHLPFTNKQDLRDNYPFGLFAVPREQVVRIHASSGTTGKRKVLTYTQNDVDTWKHMFARCYELAGLTTKDRVQVCTGYGLWTAGVGFQLGCEHFGAMAVPVGPGMLDIQLQMLVDLRTTCLCSTASMALLMGEEVERHGLRDKLALKRCIFGSEAHTPKMRRQFERALGLEASFDISGMTELYGPGAGLECEARNGIHYWADLYVVEILDPATLEPVEPGQVGEMVVTSLRKEASPLIRYRTRDLTRLLPGACSCGLCMPRHDRIQGRSDDMFIFRGVNIYPGQIAAVLEKFREFSSEYQICLRREEGLDHMKVRLERLPGATDESAALAKAVADEIRRQILVRGEVEILPPGTLPRSFSKTKRVVDDRDKE